MGEVKRRFEDNQKHLFGGFYIIACFMAVMSKMHPKETKRDHCKKFLGFHNNDFEDLHLLSLLDSALSRPQNHWEIVKEFLGEINSKLRKINIPVFPCVRRTSRIFGTIIVTSCTCNRSFSSINLFKSILWNTITSNEINPLAM